MAFLLSICKKFLRVVSHFTKIKKMFEDREMLHCFKVDHTRKKCDFLLEMFFFVLNTPPSFAPSPRKPQIRTSFHALLLPHFWA